MEVDADTTPTTPTHDDSALPMDQLENRIYRWVELDNTIAECNHRLRDLRAEKNALTPSICNTLVTNQLDGQCINITDGTLACVDKRTKEGLTRRSVMRGLAAYFNNDDDKVQECMAAIERSRLVTTQKTMQRKFNSA